MTNNRTIAFCLLVGVVAAGVVGGCSGGAPSTGQIATANGAAATLDPTPTPAPEPTPTPTPTPTPAPRFVLTGSMSVARDSTTATLLNDGRVLVVGGCTSPSDEALASAETYDPASSKFSPTASMHLGRRSHTATLLRNGRVLVVGGYIGKPAKGWSPDITPTAEIYDPASGKFTDTGPLQTARALHTATLLQDGRVLVVGGVQPVSVAAASSAEIYDPATGKFSPAGSLKFGRYLHTATSLLDGRVLIAGGATPFEVGKEESQEFPAEVWDPKTQKFAVTGISQPSRRGHTATLLPDGRVLFLGGEMSVSGAWYGVYDPSTASYSAVSATGADTETMLADGRVLECGSWIPDDALFAKGGAQAWLYDPVTDKESEAAPMTTPRGFPTATLLQDGTVLVVGGAKSENDAVVALASAELYVP